MVTTRFLLLDSRLLGWQEEKNFFFRHFQLFPVILCFCGLVRGEIYSGKYRRRWVTIRKLFGWRVMRENCFCSRFTFHVTSRHPECYRKEGFGLSGGGGKKLAEIGCQAIDEPKFLQTLDQHCRVPLENLSCVPYYTDVCKKEAFWKASKRLKSRIKSCVRGTSGPKEGVSFNHWVWVFNGFS